MTATGGETKADPSGWTVDTLRVHLTELLDDADRRYAALRAADKEAIKTALDASERRFEAVNEFRGQLADQAARLIPRAEAQVSFNAMQARLDSLENWRSRASGAFALGLLLSGAVGAAVMKAFGT